MKYSEIKDIESLDAARKALTSKIDRKGRRVVSSWEDFCDSYSPSGLIATGLKCISGSVPFDRLALTGLRFLKRKLF